MTEEFNEEKDEIFESNENDKFEYIPSNVAMLKIDMETAYVKILQCILEYESNLHQQKTTIDDIDNSETIQVKMIEIPVNILCKCKKSNDETISCLFMEYTIHEHVSNLIITYEDFNKL